METYTAALGGPWQVATIVAAQALLSILSEFPQRQGKKHLLRFERLGQFNFNSRKGGSREGLRRVSPLYDKMTL
jgi:hypothetical protein